MKKPFPQRLALVLKSTTIGLFLVASISSVAIAAPQVPNKKQDQPKNRTGIGPVTSQRTSKSFHGFQQNQLLVESDKAKSTSKGKSTSENLKRNQNVAQKPVNLEAIQEIESIRQQLGLAIFPDQKGSSQFKTQVGKLMSEEAKASVQALDLPNPLLTPPKVRKATKADFPATPNITLEKASTPKTTKPRAHGKHTQSHPLAGNRAIPRPHHQNVGPQIPPMIHTRSNSAPWLIKKAEFTVGNPRPPVVVHGTPVLSPLDIESKVQQTIDVLYDSVGELDRSALAFERAGENARADVFRQLSKTLREQIVETKLRLEDPDCPPVEDGGTLVD